MRHVPTLARCLVLAPLLAACTTTTPVPAAAAATFVVVRHAEKADDGSRDPPLTVAGAARAQRLAAMLRVTPLVAAYATGYRRTQQTAAPTAEVHGIAVTAYAAAEPAADFAARLRKSHAAGTVLVVGHGNTAPQIAAALCRCAATPLGEHDYGRVYRVDVDSGGQAALQETVSP